MDSREFIPFGLSHWVALAATAAAAAGFIMMHRSKTVRERTKRRFDLGLAWALVVAVAADPVLTYFRYQGDGAAYAWTLVLDNSLPLYLCDVVSLVLAAALITRKQRLAEIGYLWGMGGTVQGLLTPSLYFDWGSPEYYAFFVEHSGVPVAAAVLVWGLGLKPQPGAFLRAVLLSWLYLAIVMLLNVLLGRNYGFLNGKPEVPSLMDYMGPEPWYLVTLNLVAFSFYALLLLPFRREWRLRAEMEKREADCPA